MDWSITASSKPTPSLVSVSSDASLRTTASTAFAVLSSAASNRRLAVSITARYSQRLLAHHIKSVAAPSVHVRRLRNDHRAPVMIAAPHRASNPVLDESEWFLFPVCAAIDGYVPRWRCSPRRCPSCTRLPRAWRARRSLPDGGPTSTES